MRNQFSHYLALPNVEAEEVAFLEQITNKISEEEKTQFYFLYASRRRNPIHTLLATLCGFVGFAGVQRFLVGNVVLGVLYFITGGFLFVGTIWDLLSYKRLTANYNNQTAYECLRLLHAGKMNLSKVF